MPSRPEPEPPVEQPAQPLVEQPAPAEPDAPAEQPPEPPAERNEGRGAMRVLKGCGIAVGVVVGLFIVLLILGAIFGEPRDENDTETPAPRQSKRPTPSRKSSPPRLPS